MSIRSATRKILKLVKLPNLETFKLSVDGLIDNLERHPQVCFVGHTAFFLSFSVTSMADFYHFFPG